MPLASFDRQCSSQPKGPITSIYPGLLEAFVPSVMNGAFDHRGNFEPIVQNPNHIVATEFAGERVLHLISSAGATTAYLRSAYATGLTSAAWIFRVGKTGGSRANSAIWNVDSGRCTLKFTSTGSVLTLALRSAIFDTQTEWNWTIPSSVVGRLASFVVCWDGGYDARAYADGLALTLASTTPGTAITTMYAVTSQSWFGNAGFENETAISFVARLSHAVAEGTALDLSRNPWQIVSERRRAQFAGPSGVATVSADGVIRWSLISAVQADQALRWSLQAAVNRETSLLWSLLQSVQSDATARWSLIAAINADATLRYSLVEAVQQDAALRWSMLAAVSADATLLWDMAGATGVVSRDFAARWSMLAPVNADVALHWSLLNAVARDQSLPWSMVQAIASDSALRWSLIQAVQADADIAWSLVQAVSADAVLAWDLASSLGTVGASLSLRWSLIAAVQRSIDARWSLLQSVGADAEMRWDLLTSLTAELTARWSMIGRAMADTPIRWDLIAASATDLVIRWQVGEVFDLVVRKRFVAGAGMRRSFVV